MISKFKDIKKVKGQKPKNKDDAKRHPYFLALYTNWSIVYITKK
jgi:hypothetical protein